MPIIDLSAPIKSSPEGTPDVLRTEIEHSGHEQGAGVIKELFGVGPDLLRDGEGWANDFITRLGTHNSTHVDAPWHYNSTIAGEPARTIEQLPLEWFVKPGVVLDFEGRDDGEVIEVADVESALDRAGHELQPLDIVLVHTGCDRWIESPEYMAHGPGVSADATRWLFEHGVRVMGIDAWGWDRPLWMQARDAIEKDEKGIFWEAHQADLPYSQIERLVNLGALPPTGFTVSCLPLPIVGGSAAPARVVAIVEQS